MKNKFVYNPNRTRHAINQSKPLNTYERFGIGIGIIIGCGVLITVYTVVLLSWALIQ